MYFKYEASIRCTKMIVIKKGKGEKYPLQKEIQANKNLGSD